MKRLAVLPVLALAAVAEGSAAVTVTARDRAAGFTLNGRNCGGR